LAALLVGPGGDGLCSEGFLAVGSSSCRRRGAFGVPRSARLCPLPSGWRRFRVRQGVPAGPHWLLSFQGQKQGWVVLGLPGVGGRGLPHQFQPVTGGGLSLPRAAGCSPLPSAPVSPGMLSASSSLRGVFGWSPRLLRVVECGEAVCTCRKGSVAVLLVWFSSSPQHTGERFTASLAYQESPELRWV